MTEYPVDIMKPAEEALDNMLCNCIEASGSAAAFRKDSITDIAKAIMAERERCARIADAHALDFEKQAERQADGSMHDSLMRVADGCELVADAIRTQSEK